MVEGTARDSSLQGRHLGPDVLDARGSLVQDNHCLKEETTAEGHTL